MRIVLVIYLLVTHLSFAKEPVSFTRPSPTISLEGAQMLAELALKSANKLNKNITIAIVDAQGETVLVYRGDDVGPHNTEAARRKAFTALSTKTPTLTLSRNARENSDTINLAHLPELLLLGGGHPIWQKEKVVGAIGVAGAGGPENDHLIATQASVLESK